MDSRSVGMEEDTARALLLDHRREALTDTGDADTVTGLLTELLRRAMARPSSGLLTAGPATLPT